MRTRGFEKITKYMDVDFPMPERKTQLSAGYDFCLPEAVTLEPGKLQLVPTGVKAYMQGGEYLGMHIRSSMAVKKHIMLVNNVGIIDADYYNNEDNEGHIMLALLNMGEAPITLPKGERVAQGIFYNYLVADGDGDTEKAVRGGGFGSTSK
ncbi:dUTP diphosphatase [Phascolarctobacterium sp.]|uniref:dUTP diphosphatase n=1 Tax=Phascolarctobacterium sp. TaxID=2049039 RepID=UPI003862EC65